jgi:nucleoside-diphosphate-sugar epimerase
MKYLVTGSSGFIGSHLVCHLAEEGHEICGLDSRAPISPQPGQVIRCDLLDKDAIRKAVGSFQPEVVIHLAAKTSLREVPPGHPHFAANTQGTANLIMAAKEAGTVRRILFTSTKYVHRGDQPLTDRDYSPTTSYGRSKAEMEELIWKCDGGVAEWCITRPTTIWGPGMSPHYQKFLRMLRSGAYFHIGSRPVLKHMGYVGNVAYQYLRLSTAPVESIHRKVFYLSDYEAMVLQEWAEHLRVAMNGPKIRTMPLSFARICATGGDLIAKIFYRKFPFTSFRLDNLTLDDVCDPRSTAEVCGALPFTIQEGAENTGRWFCGLDSI